MKTLGILIQRHWLAGFGALIGTSLGYVSGGHWKWILIGPPSIMLLLMLLDFCASKILRQPIT